MVQVFASQGSSHQVQGQVRIENLLRKLQKSWVGVTQRCIEFSPRCSKQLTSALRPTPYKNKLSRRNIFEIMPTCESAPICRVPCCDCGTPLCALYTIFSTKMTLSTSTHPS